MIRMPGKSYTGPLPPLDEHMLALKADMERHVTVLSVDIGDRGIHRSSNLAAAADYIEEQFRSAGYDVQRQSYEVQRKQCFNIEVEKRGRVRPDEIVVIGGHYDSVYGCPGANDNATGAAATLSLARRFYDLEVDRTLRFVAFVNEEPPHFQTRDMGSLVYARRCRERNEDVVAMLSLETIGFYSDEKRSQKYPFPFSLFYPSKGNFIGFIGNVKSGKLVKRCIATFRRQAMFPSEGAAIPSTVPGVGWSDHWSFWQQGYPALMLTDTAPFRYAHYHTTADTIDKIDFERTARVVAGLEHVIADLATEK